jgi:AraC-like DNA-binding protein
MKYWYERSNSLLSEYLRTVLILEGFSEPGSDKLPILTNGVPGFICKTEKVEAGNENILQLTLFGKSIPEEYLYINENTTVIIYFFKPFALTSMFNISATELLKSPIDLSDWNAHKTNALKTQLFYADSTTRKIEILDNLLIHQLQDQKKECAVIKLATDEMMINTSKDVLAELIKKLDLNERTFQRIFKKYVGVTASQYRRICQFQVSFTQVREKNFDKLTDVAYDNGFADQSHFIRSFKEFTQITPNDYLKSGLKNKKE